MQLNLPQYSHNIRKGSTHLEIFCLIRRKWYVLSPEEWVRQNVTQYLIETCGFSISRIAFERELEVIGKKMRPDIVVFDDQFNVHGIIECKAPFIELNQQVLDQIGRYNRVLNADWIGVSNGMHHFFCPSGRSWEMTWPSKLN